MNWPIRKCKGPKEVKRKKGINWESHTPIVTLSQKVVIPPTPDLLERTATGHNTTAQIDYIAEVGRKELQERMIVAKDKQRAELEKAEKKKQRAELLRSVTNNNNNNQSSNSSSSTSISNNQ